MPPAKNHRMMYPAKVGMEGFLSMRNPRLFPVLAWSFKPIRGFFAGFGRDGGNRKGGESARKPLSRARWSGNCRVIVISRTPPRPGDGRRAQMDWRRRPLVIDAKTREAILLDPSYPPSCPPRSCCMQSRARRSSSKAGQRSIWTFGHLAISRILAGKCGLITKADVSRRILLADAGRRQRERTSTSWNMPKSSQHSSSMAEKFRGRCHVEPTAARTDVRAAISTIMVHDADSRCSRHCSGARLRQQPER